MKLDIVPYIGAPPLVFGATEAEVEALLGAPEHRLNCQFPQGWVELSYPGPVMAFDSKGRLAQMGFDRHFEGTVMLHGVDLFRDIDALEKLLKLDPDVYLWVGFVIFLGLGVRLGGFHQTADGGRTVSIFERGRYDAKRPRMQPVGPNLLPSQDDES